MLKIHKLLALLLSVMLLVSALPITTFAEAESTVDSEETMEPPTDMETIETEGPDTPEATEPSAEPESSNDEAPSDEQAEETPVPEDAPTEEPTVTEPEEEIVPDETAVPVPDSIESAIATNGHVYVMTAGTTDVYATADRTKLIFTITQDSAVLLATEYVPRVDASSVKVWFLTAAGETITAYVSEATISDALLTDEEANVLADTQHAAWVSSDAGELLAFVIAGEKPAMPTEAPAEVIPSQEPTQEPIAEEPTSTPTQEPVLLEEPAEENTPEPVPETTEAPVTEEPTEVPAAEPPSAQAGDFVAITTRTRVYPSIDETAADDYDGELSLGVFVNDASVQVETVEQDSLGRYWYRVLYMYGDDFADGTLKWTDYGTLYVLTSETEETTEQDFTVTDYAFTSVPRTFSLLRSTTPMNGFSLKTINAAIPSLYVGQSGVYGSSGKDSDYLQIAKSTDHGTIYATPHYLNGFTVYCLEHNYPGPGENISGGGQEPTGPYLIVDIDSYRNTPGYSSIIYHDSTLHAIAWVLRHTYPFMVLNRSDSDNEVWSRVAGQFAIRQVIRELEGAQYVRSYWDMDNFYRASGQAPAVYLEYARWLAANGIARASITGNINISGKSVTSANGTYTGTVTLTTDADLMRVSKSVGSLTGNTAGSDGSYYYLNSGDTVSLSSSANSFTLTVESVSSEDEEASFLVGVPSVELQKMLIPQYGSPYEMKSVSVQFEVPLGSVAVTKTDAITGAVLAGAVFELLDTAGNVLQTQTTDASGTVAFANLQPGTYRIREKTAPEGYTVSVTGTQSVSVTAGTVSTVTFANDVMTAKIRIVKTDQLTKQPLSGVEFTITRLFSPAGRNGIGEVAAVITTDENGAAETGWLDWGRYRVEETKVPEHFVDNNFSIEIEAYENGKTYTVEVENEPAKGWIRLTKTDALDDTPIAGVVFDIYANDEYGSELVVNMTTGEDGVALSEPLRKGSYIVREHENPVGYVSEPAELNAVVLSDEITDISASNTPIQGKIRIIKKDQLTGEALSGAEFTITRVSGLPSHNGSNDSEVVAVITTDANGIAESPLLTWGTYRIEETVVPQHFVDNAFSTEAVIDTESQICEIVAENEPAKGWIRITKIDALDGTPIAGVIFDIYANDEYGSELVGNMTTGEDGVAVSEPLCKGSYIVREHENPVGYVSELAELNTVVLSDEITDISASNTPIQGKIRIVKTDQLTGAVLSGAEFTITRVSGLPSHNGSNDGEVVAVITTDANGIAESPLLTWGTYRVEETAVPEHFIDNNFSTEVVIDTESQTYEIVVENEPTKGWLRLTKTDCLNGNPIEGVQFDIYYNDAYGEGLACTMVTGADGIAVSEPLRKGRYIVREHGETAGYVFEEITLDATVKSNETTELFVTNCPVTVKLKLYKRDADEYDGDNPNASSNARASNDLPEPTNISTPATRGDGILTDAEFQVLAGADITDRQGNVVYAKGDIVVDSLKTAGDDASVTTDELWPGLYEIVEITPPTGYQPSETTFFVDARSAATQSTEAVVLYEGLKTNEIMTGRYAIVKFLGDNEVHDDAGIVETPEAGAEFEVYLKSAGSYENAREFERDYITTNQYGYAIAKLLPYGVYVLKQVKGQDGYAIKSPIDIFIRGTEDPDDPPILTINNEAIRYRLKFIKVDAETGNTIAVANTAFKLKDSEGKTVTQTVHYPNEATIDTFYTDETGEVTLPETVTYGLYSIEELVSPDGYLILTEDLDVFVGDEIMNQPGEAYLLELEIPNEPVKGNIVVEKKGLQLTGFETLTDAYGNEIQQPIYEEAYLAGVVFEVRAAETIIGKDGTLWYEQDELVDTITTTASGADASMLLPLGRYYLIETAAPEGYAFDDTHYEADLVYADDQAPLVETKITLVNEYLPVEITLQKEKEILKTTNHDDGIVTQAIANAPGQGFVFGLFNDKDIHYNGGTLMADTLVATGSTDADGNLTFAGHYPHGDYYIKELSAPDGWKLNPDVFPITLDPSAQSDSVIRVALPEPVYDELIYTRITLTKMDITGENTLPGALIEVSNSSGEVIYRSYTDDNGQIPDIPVTPGTYTFREVFAPDGYALSEAEMSFTVDEYGNVTGDTVIRDDYSHVSLRKQNEDGLPLAGVEFALLKADGSTLMTAVSNELGLVSFERIPYGNYTIVETAPPTGYLKSDTSIQLTVDGSFVNPTEPIATVVNCPNEIILKKEDTEGNPLAGTAFALLNVYGEQIMTAVSDADGIARFVKIPYGQYTLSET
ncbi:MAG: SpaA isopeptide-forming pilin-related protein, partial [Eubacteriales bacterium]|nr:SpaA isopeptide-forming pilin-related protein [Eubacteriales bacterium]